MGPDPMNQRPTSPARRIDPSDRLLPRLSIMIGAFLLIGSSACAPDSGPDPGPGRVGRQNFACSDGSEVQVDFISNGLTIDLAPLPEGRSERLNAPGRGFPFVSNDKSVYLSGGGIVIVPTEGPSLSCRPVEPGSRTRLAPPTEARSMRRFPEVERSTASTRRQEDHDQKA